EMGRKNTPSGVPPPHSSARSSLTRFSDSEGDEPASSLTEDGEDSGCGGERVESASAEVVLGLVGEDDSVVTVESRFVDTMEASATTNGGKVSSNECDKFRFVLLRRGRPFINAGLSGSGSVWKEKRLEVTKWLKMV